MTELLFVLFSLMVVAVFGFLYVRRFNKRSFHYKEYAEKFGFEYQWAVSRDNLQSLISNDIWNFHIFKFLSKFGTIDNLVVCKANSYDIYIMDITLPLYKIIFPVRCTVFLIEKKGKDFYEQRKVSFWAKLFGLLGPVFKNHTNGDLFENDYILESDSRFMCLCLFDNLVNTSNFEFFIEKINRGR